MKNLIILMLLVFNNFYLDIDSSYSDSIETDSPNHSFKKRLSQKRDYNYSDESTDKSPCTEIEYVSNSYSDDSMGQNCDGMIKRLNMMNGQDIRRERGFSIDFAQVTLEAEAFQKINTAAELLNTNLLYVQEDISVAGKLLEILQDYKILLKH